MHTDNPWGLTPAQIKAHKTVELHMMAVRQRMKDHTIGCCVVWAKWSIADD